MAIEVKLPDLGEGIETADVLNVLVNEGDDIQKDQDLVEIETDKATAEVPSPQAGKVMKIHVAAGDTIKVGAMLITLEGVGAVGAEAELAKPLPVVASEETEPAAEEELESPREQPEAPVPAKPQAAAAGPAVRRFAREVGVDLATVAGSGPGGRIQREDILVAVRAANQPAPAAAVAPLDAPPAPEVVTPPGDESTDAWGPIRVERMPKIRRTIAAKMFESWSTIPRVTNFDDADVTELEKVRQKSKQDYAAAGIKLTAMPFLIKAVAMSLKAHPVMNASIDVEAGQIIYKQYVNVGIAVDTDRGLVVPSLRDADRLCIADVARALATIAENARTNSFTIEDLRGSTFTISNLGAIGGSYSTPILNPPEVAILLMGRSRKMPVVVDDQIAVRLMMPLSISYDHRLVDGAAAARFLNEVKGFLETPSRLLLAP